MTDMTMKRTVLISAIVMSIITSAADAQNKYTNPVHRFKIEFPQGWQIKGSSQENTLIKAVSTTPEGTVTLIAIAKYDVPSSGSIDQATYSIWDLRSEDMIQSLQNEFPNSTIQLFSFEKTRIGGIKATRTAFSAHPANRRNPIFGLGYHIVRGSSVFRISAATNGSKTWFKKKEQMIMKSIESFRFID